MIIPDPLVVDIPIPVPTNYIYEKSITPDLNDIFNNLDLSVPTISSSVAPEQITLLFPDVLSDYDSNNLNEAMKLQGWNFISSGLV